MKMTFECLKVARQIKYPASYTLYRFLLKTKIRSKLEIIVCKDDLKRLLFDFVSGVAGV